MTTALALLAALLLPAEVREAECARLLASGAVSLAEPICAAAGQPVASAFQAALVPPKADFPTLAVQLELARSAAGARPLGAVEEGLVLDLSRRLRALARDRVLPEAIRAPLLPLPTPDLPPLEDPALDNNQAALNRSQARAEDPGQKPELIARHQAEARRLLETRVAALEQAFQADPSLGLVYWLHLAAAYHALDQSDRRAEQVLERALAAFPQDALARVAAAWWGAMALSADRPTEALRRLKLAPGYSLARLVAAQAQWRLGDLDAAEAELKALPPDRWPAHQAALSAELAFHRGRPAAEARAWLTVSEHTQGAVKRQARLRAAAATADALIQDAAALPEDQFPADLWPAILTHLVRLGQLDLAQRYLAKLQGDEAFIADWSLMVLDAHRARGDDASADRLLSDLFARFPTEGPARARLLDRALTRFKPLMDSPAPVSLSTVDELDGALTAWLQDLRPSARLAAAAHLGALGFERRALAVLARLREDPGTEPALALAAAKEALTLTTHSALLAAARGRPVGPWLTGEPSPDGLLLETRQVLDAVQALLALEPTSEWRLLRARLRAEEGRLDLALPELEALTQRPEPALALEAALTWQWWAPSPSRAELLARGGVGSAWRETQLKRLTIARAERATNRATAYFERGLYSSAADAFGALAASGDPGWKLSQALSLAAGLRPKEALAATEEALKLAPPGPLAVAAQSLRQELLTLTGQRGLLVGALSEAPDALATLERLRPSSPAGQRPPVIRPAAPPPPPQAPCHARCRAYIVL